MSASESYFDDADSELSDSAALSTTSAVAPPPRRKRRASAPPLNYLHQAALIYHELGLPITLCQGKAPWQPDWPSLNWSPRLIDAAYKQHGAANVGILLGERSGLVDFECDDADSEQTLLDLFGGTIPQTPTWQSRRGLHRLFQYHPALATLRKNKIFVGEDGGKVEVLIGPSVQTLLPPSYADGVQREWICGEKLFPDRAAAIPVAVLEKLGCALAGSAVAAVPAQLDTDRVPSSVISVVSVISVSTHDAATSHRIMAVIERCTVRASGTTNDKFVSLAIALKDLPELTGAMGEELEPYIRSWYEASLPYMQEQNWQAVWERWLSLWLWAKPGHDTVRIAFDIAKQEPLPRCSLNYPIAPMRQLIGLCRVLQNQFADDRGLWFLACRSAAQQLGMGHVFAAKLLKLLVADGILEIVEPSTTVRAPRYRYRGD